MRLRETFKTILIKCLIILILTLMLSVSTAISESTSALLQEMYAQAELLMVQGDYTEAAAAFESLGAYSDASKMTMYCKAIAAAENFNLYAMAIDAFHNLGEFKDSKQMAQYYEGRVYEASGVIDVIVASDASLEESIQYYEEAYKIYSELALFKDCLTRLSTCSENIQKIKNEQSRRAEEAKEAAYQKALAFEQSSDHAAAIRLYKTIKGYKDSTNRIELCQNIINEAIYQEALILEQNSDYTGAIDLYRRIKGYKDNADRIKLCQDAIDESVYQKAIALEQNSDYTKAAELFKTIKGYKDSSERYDSCIAADVEPIIGIGKINRPVNVRDIPSKDGKVIRQLNKGTQINIHTIDGQWYKISTSTNQTKGWVRDYVVQISGS